jgi:hypothetical protein
MDDLVGRLLTIVRGRMKDLEPQVGEARWLQEQLAIVNYAIGVRDDLLAQIERLSRPPATRENIDRWGNNLEADLIVRADDLAEYFDKTATWARNHLNRMVKEGILEKWGKGQFRRKPDRAGEARLHLVTKGA